jgi:hypothetical protein
MSDETPMTTCHHCGLEVPAKRGGPTPVRHVRQAVAAGQADALCVQQQNAQEKRHRQSLKDRRRWAKELAEERERLANRDTTLPKHLR